MALNRFFFPFPNNNPQRHTSCCCSNHVWTVCQGGIRDQKGPFSFSLIQAHWPLGGTWHTYKTCSTRSTLPEPAAKVWHKNHCIFGLHSPFWDSCWTMEWGGFSLQLFLPAWFLMRMDAKGCLQGTGGSLRFTGDVQTHQLLPRRTSLEELL